MYIYLCIYTVTHQKGVIHIYIYTCAVYIQYPCYMRSMYRISSRKHWKHLCYVPAVDVGNWSICSDLCWCFSLGIYISLYFLIAIITEKNMFYVLYISWISGFIWHTHISHMVWTCLKHHFAYQIVFFLSEPSTTKNDSPEKNEHDTGKSPISL